MNTSRLYKKDGKCMPYPSISCGMFMYKSLGSIFPLFHDVSLDLVYQFSFFQISQLFSNVVLPYYLYVFSFYHYSFILMNLSLLRYSFIQIFPIWYFVYHLTLWFMMIYLKTSTLTWCNLSPFLPSQNTYVMFDSWMCIVFLIM